MNPLLDVRGLDVTLRDGRRVLHDVAFTLARGETLGLVGESGGGKSLTALALMGLLPAGAHRSGTILFDGEPLDEAALDRWRGRRLAMVFQEPMTALDPLQTIARQIAEPLRLHRGLSRRDARAEALKLLRQVRMPEPQRRLDAFPHQLSGGQRQRAMIAMMLAGDPELLIADEPTTALDARLRNEILDLLQQAVAERGMALILVSHDLAEVARRVRRIGVMQGGTLVEIGETDEVFGRPAHAHTRALLAARPRLDVSTTGQARKGEAPLLVALHVWKQYDLPRRRPWSARPIAHALQDVSFQLHAGRHLGIVGESGSGKSTLARLILGLEAPSDGRITLSGRELVRLKGRELLEARRGAQMVFQDPKGSLDPRQRVGRIVAEPLPPMPRAERERRIDEALEAVGLRASDAQRHPHEFSGGQRQRIAIARALVGRPRLIVADEPVSALDLSVQAQVLDLLAELQARYDITYVLISHDLPVVARLCPEVIVLEAGRIVERGATAEVFATPRHPVTQALLEAARG